MNRFRIAAVGGAATLLLAGVGIASASNHGSAVATHSVTRAQVISQIHAAEARAIANHNTQALQALQNAERALTTQKAKSEDPPPPCPSTAPRAGLPQPCGYAYGFFKNHPTPKPCPSSAPNHGGKQPCGQPQPSASPTGNPPPPAACGPADQGGSAAEGPISSILYQVGLAISDNGGAPLGDLVQQVACAVYDNLGL